MVIVHVGLGKTATTTLQNDVFPRLLRTRPHLAYNPEWLLAAARKHHLFGLTEDELRRVRGFLATHDCLVSLESLASWNPREWERAAERNAELFGPEAAIVITVREPVSYLTSVYQQSIHEGNVRPPEDFFVRAPLYDLLVTQLPGWRLDYFDVDAFDLERLHGLYSRRFADVAMVPMQQIGSFAFLRGPMSLTGEEVADLAAAFRAAPPSNRSYSAFAMRLTFARERLFDALGARSVGTRDRDLVELAGQLQARIEAGPGGLGRSPKKKKRKAGLLRRLSGGRFRLRWRQLMQNHVDRWVTYRKYQLPASVDLNQDLVARNRAYLDRLSAEGKTTPASS